jgi:hypothetical protein
MMAECQHSPPTGDLVKKKVNPTTPLAVDANAAGMGDDSAIAEDRLANLEEMAIAEDRLANLEAMAKQSHAQLLHETGGLGKDKIAATESPKSLSTQERLQAVERMARETHTMMMKREELQEKRHAESLREIRENADEMTELVAKVKLHRAGQSSWDLKECEETQKQAAAAERREKDLASAEAQLVHHHTIEKRADENRESLFTVKKFLALCEGPISLLIILNAIHIGAEAHYAVSSCSPYELAMDVVPKNQCDSHPVFKYISYVFTAVFSLELFLKIYVQNIEFLSRANIDFRWNLFDSIIVALSLGDLLIEFVSSGGGVDLGQVKVVRVLRVVRIMRILRTIKFVKDLRVMLEGIMASGSAIVWALLILIGMQYILSIVIMNIVKLTLENTAGSESESDIDNRRLLLDPANGYTKLNDIIWNLFLGITGGADWADYVTPLCQLGLEWKWVFRLMFMIYVSVVQLCVLNILTGVFVENANKITGHDEANMLSAEMEERTRFNKTLLEIFEEVCENDEGVLDFEGFQAIVADESIKAELNKLGVDVDEETAPQFFATIDFDNDGLISCEDFQSGIYRMHGPAQSIDMAQLIVNSEKTNAQLQKVQDFLQGSRPKTCPRPKPPPDSESPSPAELKKMISRQSMKFEQGADQIRQSRKSVGANRNSASNGKLKRVSMALGAMGQGMQGGPQRGY